jgi:plasmid stability protein
MNLTLAIDEEVLLRARIRALRERTSVNALVRTLLTNYAGAADEEAPMAWLLDLSARSTAASGAGGRTWTREDAHER